MERTKKHNFKASNIPALLQKNKKADAILTADWHLQETVPVARTDDFLEAQWRKLDFISNLQKKHNCPVIHSGDLYDFWKPSCELEAMVMDHLPNRFMTVYGNHDLPQHNIKLKHKSGICVLEKAGKLQVFPTCHWLEEPTKPSWQGLFTQDVERKVLVWHIMTYQGKEPFPGCTAPMGAKLLRKYPEYDLIVTGDNHVPFVETHQGRLLVNPGSIFRTTASQQNHKPRVYLWYAETNTVEPVYLPIEKDVISRDHIEEKQNRDNRIDAFISTLNEDWQAEMSFEDNIEKFRQANKVRQSVMDIIYKAIES